MPQQVLIAIANDPLTIQLEEYRQLYALGLYRLQVLDQRIPLATAALTAALGSVIVLPTPLQMSALVAIPLASTMLCLSTLNHVRSLQDALSGIAALEKQINARLSETVLSFQSRHPSRLVVGGRTGSETAAIVMTATMAITLVSAVGTWNLGGISLVGTTLHSIFAILLLTLSGREWFRLQKYRYEPKLDHST